MNESVDVCDMLTTGGPCMVAGVRYRKQAAADGNSAQIEKPGSSHAVATNASSTKSKYNQNNNVKVRDENDS